MRKYFGMDTETPMGNLRVVATDKEVVEVETFIDVCDFLLQPQYQSSIMYSFNLHFDAEAILKSINNLDLLTELYHFGGKPEGLWYNNNLKIRWINSKFLQICKGSKEKKRGFKCTRIYDIAQFYSGWKLEKVARKYLGSYKNPIDAHRLGSEEGYYEDNRREVLEYCRKDAELALKAAVLMKETIEATTMKKGKLSFKNPISQAKVSEMYVKKYYNYPYISDKLDKFHFYAYLTYHGGIFSTLKRGLFNQKLYLYDINSAYPFQMQDLPHWSNGKFKVVKKPNEIDTDYGWFKCIFDCEWIPYADFSKPYEVYFKYKNIEEQVKLNPKRMVYPTGSRKVWITKIEYEWLLKHNYPVKFFIGFVWEKEKDKYINPFSWCEDVYNRRREIRKKDKEDIKQYSLKIVMNGAYGKTAQAKKGFGAMTNFFYASYITAKTRLQLCDIVLENPNSIVELATDSILSLEPLSVNISGKLGDWSLKEYKSGLLVGSGMRQLWENEEEFKTSARGLTDKTDWDMLDAMKNGYNKIEKKANKYCTYLYFEKERPIHLGEIIFHHKTLSLKDLIVFQKVGKKLNVNTDKKRRWEREYRDFEDLLTSKPMNSLPLEIEGLNANKNKTQR